MVSAHLSFDLLSVLSSFSMQVLLAASLADGGHCLHPKVIRICSERVKGLLESDLDFEAISIDADDLEGSERSQRCHEDRSSSGGVLNENKTHELSQGTPEEIHTEVLDADIVFSVDGAGSFDEIGAALPAISETDLFSIELWAAAFWFLRAWRAVVCNGSGFYSRKEVVSLAKERLDYFPTGIVGIGNEYGSVP